MFLCRNLLYLDVGLLSMGLPPKEANGVVFGLGSYLILVADSYATVVVFPNCRMCSDFIGSLHSKVGRHFVDE